MKLISCCIENFGIFSGKEFDFAPGLNSFCLENGQGKSTLAAFICAMLYGMPNCTKRTNAGDEDKEFPYRAHYYPFKGGKFGGRLTFMYRDKEYTLTRFFDKASSTKDDMHLYDAYGNSAVLPDSIPGRAPGETVFGVGEESFRRTLFVSEWKTTVCATSDISKRMNRWVDADENGVGYEKARALLEDKCKELKPARGNGGALALLETQMDEKEATIAGLENVERALEGKYRALNELKEQIDALEEETRREAKAERERLLWERYDRTVQSVDEQKQILADLTRRYPQGLPAAETLTHWQTLAQRMERLHGVEAGLAPDPVKERERAALEELFAAGLPDEAAFDALEPVFSDREQFRRQAGEGIPDPDEAARRRAERFGERLPDEETLRQLAERREEWQQKKKQWELSFSPEVISGKKKTGIPGFLPWLMGGGLLIAGGVLSIFALIPGLLLLVAGVMTLGIYAFLSVRGGISAGSIEKERMAYRMERDKAEEDLREMLAQYRYSCRDMAEDLAAFDRDLDAFRKDLAAKAAEQEKRERLSGGIRAAEAKILAFMAPYGIRDTGRETFMTLRRNAEACRRLREQEAERTEKLRETAEEMKKNQRELKQGWETYGISWDPVRSPLEAVQHLREEREQWNRAEDALRQFMDEAETFKVEKGLTERPPQTSPSGEDSERLQEDLSEKQKELSRRERELEEDEQKLEALPRLRKEREEAGERLHTLRETHRRLREALKALDAAENGLKEAYIQPVRDVFLRYARPLEQVLGEKLCMNENFQITYEIAGENRSNRHLSEGQRCLCSFCLRLALLDNMYSRETPFLLLDDPFVSLDEKHLAKALELLPLLSENRQIFYFTCHESRMPRE